MENKEEKAIRILKEYNQEHIIKWMDAQEDEAKQKIINQVLEIDLDELSPILAAYDGVVVPSAYNWSKGN